MAWMREGLAAALPGFLASQRWFGGKARTLESASVIDIVPLMSSPLEAFLAVARITYAAGAVENYSVPLILKEPEAPIPAGAPALAVHLEGEREARVLYDAMFEESFLEFLLDAIIQQKIFPGTNGKVEATHTDALAKLWNPSLGRLQPEAIRAEQSNTSTMYGRRLVFKLFRRMEEGTNPDLEMGTFLTANSQFSHTPSVAGAMEYIAADAEPCSLGILQAYVPNRGDAWSLSLLELAGYYDRAAHLSLGEEEIPRGGVLAMSNLALPPRAEERIGDYLRLAKLLAQRTAELHLALSSAPGDPAFSPESFPDAGVRAFCDSALESVRKTFALLRDRQSGLPADAQKLAGRVLASEAVAEQRARALLPFKLTAMCTRIHGDYHLGQVLFTGDDFMIIDFEGEPARSLSERRAKRSPLQDVAGMLRSFHYAAYAPLLGDPAGSRDLQHLAPWALYWQSWVSATFLRGYLDTCGDVRFLPRGPIELETLLDCYLLDKALYELRYELNNRPHWVAIPLEGIAQLLTHEI